MTPLARTLPLLLLLPCAPAPCQDRPPSRREVEKRIAEYVELERWTEGGHARALEILAELDRMPPLKEREVKSWTDRIRRQWSKGRILERSGDNWFWEEKGRGTSRRGRYLVGGETRRPKGLLIAMHGGGAGSGDAGSAAGAYDDDADKLDWVVICPEVLEKTEHGWTDSGTEEFVLQLIDAGLRTFRVDPDRVYLAGHSMGGYGSWTLGAHHADRVAAIAPSAGAPTPILQRDGTVVDIVEGVIPSLRNVFVAAYQSTDDPQVAPEPNQMAVRLLAQAAEKWGGYPHDYWEVTGRGHAMPEGGAIVHLRKIAKVVRDPVPERIVWQPALRWKRQFYWLFWERPVRDAILVADLDREANAVRITCEQGSKGLSVLLDGRVLDIDKEVVVTVNGEEAFRGIPQPSLATLLLTGAAGDPGLTFAARVPASK